MELLLNLAQATPPESGDSDIMLRFTSFIGYCVILGMCWALSTNRKAINYRTVGIGLALQFAIAILLLKVETTANIFRYFTDGVGSFLALSNEGARFLFGNMIDPGAGDWGFVFAFSVLPTIIFFSAFISVLYYYGVIQFVISAIAKAMQFLMKTSGSETLSCSANIFVGQTEAPLMIKPFIKDMTKSEINAIMIGGFATIAGGVLAAYIALGVDAGHLVTASVMAAPCALAIGKLLFPETEQSTTSGNAKMPKIDAGDNVLDAITKGTTDGLGLALNVGAMLIAFISLIAVVNWVLGGMDYYIDFVMVQGSPDEANLTGSGEFAGYFPGSLGTILGYLLMPFVILLGIPFEDAKAAGNILGLKIIINEFIAYSTMVGMDAEGTITPRTVAILSFACCGFANLSSIGIQIGGIGALAPERRTDLSKLAIRALFGGIMVSCLSACIAGMIADSDYGLGKEEAVVEQASIETEEATDDTVQQVEESALEAANESADLSGDMTEAIEAVQPDDE